MPTVVAPIIGAITAVASSVGGLVGSIGGGGILGFLGSGIGGKLAALAGGIALQLLGGLLLRPSRPAVPKPEDGKYNLRQNVPSRVRVYGTVKKSGDYLFLEQTEGRAYHIIAHASHRIQGYRTHFAHDEPLTLSEGNIGDVTNPTNFVNNGLSQVNIDVRLGANAENAYTDIVSLFPTIWSNDHRGDGIATVKMIVGSVDANDFTTVFPQSMPNHSAIMDGAIIFDPRITGTNNSAFTHNLALIRLDHLLHPSGGAQLSLDDLYLPDWINAANVCDQQVTNRLDQQEPRYHGGLWYRYDNSPVEVGRLIDQAADLIVYERRDGKIGVHAGELASSIETLNGNEIISLTFNANRNIDINILAVRGRFTDPNNRYNTTDAAIWGDPYPSEDSERSKTIDNQAVQSHNHMQRLQKLSFIRSKAPRVAVTCHYSAGRNIPYSRFLRITNHSKLNNQLVEIIGRPTISISNFTISFEAIVVPDNLYEFDGPTEEGIPNPTIQLLAPEGVPAVVGFTPVLQVDTIGPGAIGAYIVATFVRSTPGLIYEMEYEESSGANRVTVAASQEENQVRSQLLGDGRTYRARMRARSGTGAYGPYTPFQNIAVSLDPNVPAMPTGVSGSALGGTVTVLATAPGSLNVASLRLWRNTVDDFNTAVIEATVPTSANVQETLQDTLVPAGTYYYYVTAVNSSGLDSVPAPVPQNPIIV